MRPAVAHHLRRRNSASSLLTRVWKIHFCRWALTEPHSNICAREYNYGSLGAWRGSCEKKNQFLSSAISAKLIEWLDWLGPIRTLCPVYCSQTAILARFW
jgi:hypothetical protein